MQHLQPQDKIVTAAAPSECITYNNEFEINHNYYKVPEMIIGLCSGLLVSYTVPAFHISVILYSSVIFTVVVL